MIKRLSVSKLLYLCFSAILVMAMAAAAGAADVPERPESLKGKVITWNIGYAAGGATDLTARTLQQILKEMYGLDVVVQNIEGGGATISTIDCITSPPDGTKVATVGVDILTFMILGDFQAPEVKDYTWISSIHRETICLVVPKNSPIDSVEKFAELAKNGKAGSLPIGIAGTVSGVEACVFALSDVFGDAVVPVNYTGASRAVTELIGGHIPIVLAKINDMVSQMANDEVKVLFSFSYNRIPGFEGMIPAVTEFGWWGDRIPFGDPSYYTGYVIGPPGIPDDVREYLAACWAGALGSEKYRAKAKEWGVTVDPILSGKELIEVVQKHRDGQVKMVDLYYKDQVKK
jgi:tripartite-type tricarboxylate transporter receptor subunit TctC